MSQSPRKRAASISIVVLVLAGLSLAGAPAVEGKGPGRILVIEGNGNDVAIALGAITPAVPACPAPAPCYDIVGAVPFAAFLPVDYGPYSVMVVGWDPSPAMLNALQTQAGNIENWLGEGGSIVASSENPASSGVGGFRWLPEGTSYSVASYAVNGMARTALGLVHPATATVTDADLSGWSTSTHVRFTAWPSYVSPVARSTAGQEITLAGHYGQGCLVVTGQDFDWHAMAGHAGARLWLRALVDWAYSCECVDYACEPVVTVTSGDIFSPRPDDMLFWALSDAEGGALFGERDTHAETGEVRSRAPVTITLAPCRCIVTKVELTATVTSDVVPVNDGLFPTLTQTSGFSWTVTSPDADTYDVTFAVTLECPQMDGTTTVQVISKSWTMGP